MRKKYQVWADPINRLEGDTNIWRFLGETDDLDEAHEWYLTAKRQDKMYSRVQITEAIIVVSIKQ